MPESSITFQDVIRGLRENKMETFQKLRLNRKLLDIQSPLGETPLHFLSIEGEADTIENLVELGANLNSKNHFHRTALMEVVIMGNFELVKLLVKLGADLNIDTGEGETAASLACEYKHLDIARFLVANGASSSVQNIKGKTVSEYLK
ncbi:MAG: ankyrin repeat domain-containing protein [Verrucomicrobiota bacterium]